MKFGFRAFALSLLMMIFGMFQPTHASTRVALVIGNSAYGHVPDLANPANDAADIAASLRRLDFDVTVHLDLAYGGMRRALGDFSRKAYGADMALIYFAGHGLEVNRQNYLVPVDARLRANIDVEFEAIPLDRVMTAVRGAKGLRLVLLDACRNNPFIAGIDIADGSRSIGRGLARVEPQVGTLVGYAAKEGTTAADGKGRNSPYTRALLAHLEQPGLEVQFLFRKVRDSVIEQTSGRQEPFTYGSLPGKRLYLKEPEPEKPKLSKAERDRLAWADVMDTRNAGVLRHFIKRNPDNLFVGEAQRRIEMLERDALAERQRLRERIAWNVVKDSGNVTFLSNYLAEFPDSRYVAKARQRIAALEAATARKRQSEDLIKREAEARQKAEAEARLRAQARARAEAEARRLAAERQRAERIRLAAIKAAWQLAGSSSDPAVLEAFAAQYPDSQFAAEARSRAGKLKQRQKIAALQPPSQEPQQPADVKDEPPKLDKRQLALTIQKELNRLGCNAGRPDGKWGRGSKRALQGYARHAKLKLASLDPTVDLLDTLNKQKSRICPLTCGRREVEKNGKCVPKTCGLGQELNRKGTCVAKLDNQAKEKKLKCSPRHRLKGNRCVLKNCGRGKDLDRRGRCVAKRQKQDEKKRDRRNVKKAVVPKPKRAKSSSSDCGRCRGQGSATWVKRFCGRKYAIMKSRGMCNL